MRLSFTKMHGAGNDFITVDDWRKTIPWQDQALMAAIAARRTGVGCEGILLVQPPESGSDADFHMRFLNPDGREAGMCGNGARCAALFAYRHGFAGQRQRILTATGIVEAEILNPGPLSGIVRLRMPPPGELVTREVAAAGKSWTCRCIETGVPHAVVFVEDVAAVDVRTVGRALRRHATFAPAGVNVDFVQRGSDGTLLVRTYERGVEDESGACGTGAVACALVAILAKGAQSPVRLQVSSGAILTVDAEQTPEGSWRPALTGPACEVFQGILELDEFGGAPS